MAGELRERQNQAGQYFYREEDIPEEVASYIQPVNLEELLGDLTLAKLDEVFQSVLRRYADKIDPVRSGFGEIEMEEVSLEERILDVEETLKKERRTSFRKLLEGKRRRGKMQVIVTFLAVLELMKIGKLTVRQDETFGDIYIEAEGQGA